MNTFGIVLLSVLGALLVYILSKMILDYIWNKRLNAFQNRIGVKQLNIKPNLINIRRIMIALSSVVIILAIISTNIFKNPDTFYQKQLVNANKANNYLDLKSKINDKNGFYFDGWFGSPELNGLEDALAQAPRAEKDVVSTNVQIEGVDEADILKSDGYDIFYSPSYHRNIIYHFSVNPDGSLSPENGLEFTDFMVDSFYLTDDQIVVIGYKYEEVLNYYKSDLDALIMPESWYYRQYIGSVRIYERESLSKIYELDTTGSIQSHRLIDNMLYLVSYNQLLEDELRPRFIETLDEVVSTSYVDYDHILYFDNIPAYQMMTISSLNIVDFQLHSESVVGVSGVIYVTKDAIYTAGFFTYYPFINTTISGTHIIKFGIDSTNGFAKYKASTMIEGYVENQFWMDEKDDYFRVVSSRSWGLTDKNRLYIFKENDITDTFDQVGLLDEGIGKPEERVTSVRFIENEVYVVTYRNIDPLYTINLSNPNLPVITNEIEEEGYNTYLHSWGDNQAVGIGYDQNFGVKISAYNTSNKQDPLDTYSINNEVDSNYVYSYSEALHNHKAILVSPEKGFIGFAVNRSNFNNLTDVYEYNSFFLIFYIDFNQTENIISEPIMIMHQTTLYDNQVDRGIYIDQVFYTFSSKSIVLYQSESKTIIGEYLLNE